MEAGPQRCACECWEERRVEKAGLISQGHPPTLAPRLPYPFSHILTADHCGCHCTLDIWRCSQQVAGRAGGVANAGIWHLGAAASHHTQEQRGVSLVGEEKL